METNSQESGIEKSAEVAKSAMDLLRFIRERKLTAPALVMLELYKPLAGLGDALVIFAQPFLKAFSFQQRFLEVLRDRANIDFLIQELEKPQQLCASVKQG